MKAPLRETVNTERLKKEHLLEDYNHLLYPSLLSQTICKTLQSTQVLPSQQKAKAFILHQREYLGTHRQSGKLLPLYNYGCLNSVY